MSTAIVQRLVAKDWYLLRRPFAGYVTGGVVSLLMLATGGEALFDAGSILIITLLIALGMHAVTASIVGERTEQTLPFVMSLPISIAQYTIAKIVANASIFFSAWLAIAVGCFGIILLRAGVPHGLVVLSTITLLDILASYFVVLAVALTTEALGWTIVTVVVGNLFLNFLMYSVSHDPSIKTTFSSSQIVWSHSAIAIVAGECAAIFTALAATFAIQARKTDFL